MCDFSHACHAPASREGDKKLVCVTSCVRSEGSEGVGTGETTRRQFVVSSCCVCYSAAGVGLRG